MPRVLIIDDQPELLAMMHTGLQLAGYHVDTATSGPAALQAVAQHNPDVIILDFNMPGLSGTGLCASLHQLARQAPILLISGMASADEVHASLQAGAREYLRKPFELGQLLERVEALINQL